MRKLILVSGLVVAAFACSSAGDMVKELLDGSVPDAGAQPDDLVLQCELELYYRNGQGQTVSMLYAEVASSELTTPFNAYVCNDSEGVNNFLPEDLCAQPCTEPESLPRCLPAPVEIRPDGRFRFKCNGTDYFSNPTAQFPDGSYVRIVR